MEKDSKKTRNINRKWYLLGPLALVAFALMDYIGGTNYPNYDWLANSLDSLICQTSMNIVIPAVFACVFVVFATASCLLVMKYFSKLAVNGLLKKAIMLFSVGAIIFSLGFVAFPLPEANVLEQIPQLTKTVTKTETVKKESTENNANQSSESNDSNNGATVTDTNSSKVVTDGTNADKSATTANANNETEEKVVVDEEATAKNHEKLGELLSNPFTMGHVICLALGCLMAFIAFVILLFSGLAEKGVFFFAVAGCVCIILMIFGCIGIWVGATEQFGLFERLSLYSIVLFIAVQSGWVFVTKKD